MVKIKIMKCIIAAIAIISLLGCQETKSQTDYKYIKSKGSMIVGITEFAPMNYHDKDGNLVGFDTEFTEAVCAKLGIKPTFLEINWDQKEDFLSSKKIDCIWNGMTITELLQRDFSITDSYIKSKEVIVTKQGKTDILANNLHDVVISVERGSSGEQAALFLSGIAKILSVDSQLQSLKDIESNTADAAIVDYLMLFGAIGDGRDFDDLAVVPAVVSDEELIGIAFRKDSDMTPKINQIIADMKKDGFLKKLAEKYHIDTTLLD